MRYFICVACFLPVQCYKLHKSFHDSSSLKAWHGPMWWLAGFAIWSHLKEAGKPDCLCQITLNGQPNRIRIGWLWRTSSLPNTRTVNLRVRPPGFQGNAFDIWIPLRCIVLPCGKRSSACSLSWIQTVHQCNQGPLRTHLGLASLVSAFPQWPGTCGGSHRSTRKKERENEIFAQRKERKVLSLLLILCKTHGSRVLAFTLSLTITVTAIYWLPIMCQLLSPCSACVTGL